MPPWIIKVQCDFLERVHQDGGFLKKVRSTGGHQPLDVNFFENSETRQINPRNPETGKV